MLQDFVSQLKSMVSATIDDIHTAIPAAITEFDTDTCRATVKPYGTITHNGTDYDYPLISGVPIVSLCSPAAEAGVAIPVSKGNDCLLIISEYDLAQWISGKEQAVKMKFDLTNAIAITGLINEPVSHIKTASQQKLVRIYCGDTSIDVTQDNVTIKKGGAVIKVTDSGINLAGDVTISGNIFVGGNLSVSGVIEGTVI